MKRLLSLMVLSSALLGACHAKQELTAPPPPLRPEPDPPPPPPAEAQKDCDATESAEIEKLTREGYINDAVDHFITALSADPYNVTATYNLAAAYARIGRKQCSINLLTRLLQMRPHPSKHDDVEKHLDRLLGRKQVLDPDFSEMRKDARFRALIAKMCEGTNDANCVYGAQRENREK